MESKKSSKKLKLSKKTIDALGSVNANPSALAFGGSIGHCSGGGGGSGTCTSCPSNCATC